MPIRRPVSSSELMKRKNALINSGGKCQCTADLHNWHETGVVCNRTFGAKPHFVNIRYSGYKVICSKCYSALKALNY